MKITQESMIADGWRFTDDDTFPMEKAIENRNPINKTPEDSDIKLVLHRLYNSTTFAVMFPTGAMLNFIANTMQELKAFEQAIYFYDPEY